MQYTPPKNMAVCQAMFYWRLSRAVVCAANRLVKAEGEMAIRFQCKCGRTFKVADQYAGKPSRCTHCGAVLIVPAAQPPITKPAVGAPPRNALLVKLTLPPKPAAPPGTAPRPTSDAAPRQLEGWAPKPSSFPFK